MGKIRDKNRKLGKRIISNVQRWNAC